MTAITADQILARSSKDKCPLRGQAYQQLMPGDTREVIVATVHVDGSFNLCRKTHIGQDREAWSGGARGTTWIADNTTSAREVAENIAFRLNQG